MKSEEVLNSKLGLNQTEYIFLERLCDINNYKCVGYSSLYGHANFVNKNNDSIFVTKDNDMLLIETSSNNFNSHYYVNTLYNEYFAKYMVTTNNGVKLHAYQNKEELCIERNNKCIYNTSNEELVNSKDMINVLNVGKNLIIYEMNNYNDNLRLIKNK